MEPLIPFFEPPVIQFSLGDRTFPLHGFGVLVALGFVFGGKVAMGRARRLGLDPEVINRLISWLVVGTLVGGHVGYGLMYKLDEYLADPMQWLYVWQGLSSFGGFVVCVPLAVWYFWKEKVPVWPYLDCLAHGFALGWFFGRMGCFVAHDHPGTPADSFPLGVYCRPVADHTLNLPDWLAQAHGPWGPCAVDPTVMAAHDMGLYEALFSLVMFLVFYAIDRARNLTPGFYTLVLWVAYGPVRFAMDFARPEVTDNRWFGLTPAQYWAVLFTLVAMGLLMGRMKSGDPPLEPVE